MSIKQKAMEFAICSCKKSYRNPKDVVEKIIHCMDVADILSKYNFDELLIASGYLIELIKDEKCTEEEIINEFGNEVYLLIFNGEVKVKNLKRQIKYVKQIKKLNLKQKILICADNISSLEKMKLKYNKIFEYTSSDSKLGKDLDYWYFTEIYNSLIYNEDKNIPIFQELSNLIDEVYNSKMIPEVEIASEYIFSSDLEILKKLHYKKLAIVKLLSIINFEFKPFLIEIDGTFNSGKTSTILSIKKFLEARGIKVNVFNNFISNDYDLTNINDFLNQKYEELNRIIKNNPSSFIIVEHGFVDYLINLNTLKDKEIISYQEYKNIYDWYKSCIFKNINNTFITFIDSDLSIRRDYIDNLFLEIREKNNINDICSYNKSLYDVVVSLKQKKYNCLAIDVTTWSKKKMQYDILDMVLDNYFKYIIEVINDTLVKD